MAKLKVKVRCRVRHGNTVKRGKCKDVPGHTQCDVNVHDTTPNHYQQTEQMHMGAWVRRRGNLLPMLVVGEGM